MTTISSANTAAASSGTGPGKGSTITRTGKIACLPAHIQEDLNQRLAQNQPARTILPWLNGLSEVQAILKERFHTRRINEQNLSNWRRGGFHEWQYRQKYFACFRNVARDAADIESTVGNLAEHAARLLALQFSLVLCPPVALRGHKDVPDVPPAIVNTLCKIARAVSSLRRADHAAARLKLEQQPQPQKSPPSDPPLKVNQAKSSLSTPPVPPPPTLLLPSTVTTKPAPGPHRYPKPHIAPHPSPPVYRPQSIVYHPSSLPPP